SRSSTRSRRRASSAVTSTAAMLAEPWISAIHVPDDQRNVRKPAVVDARVDRDGAPLRRQVLGQLDELVSEAQPGPPQPQPEHARQMLELLAGGLEFGNLLEREDAGVELDQPSRSDTVKPVESTPAPR